MYSLLRRVLLLDVLRGERMLSRDGVKSARVEIPRIWLTDQSYDSIIQLTILMSQGVANSLLSSSS